MNYVSWTADDKKLDDKLLGQYAGHFSLNCYGLFWREKVFQFFSSLSASAGCHNSAMTDSCSVFSYIILLIIKDIFSKEMHSNKQLIINSYAFQK